MLRRRGRPSSDKAIEIARQVCLGLAAAHEAGMLHRDLKPANGMIDGRGRARITDFGLAGLADELAREGRIAGHTRLHGAEQLKEGRVSAQRRHHALGSAWCMRSSPASAPSPPPAWPTCDAAGTGSFTSLTDLVRDLDPAVERVVLRCLETDRSRAQPRRTRCSRPCPAATRWLRRCRRRDAFAGSGGQCRRPRRTGYGRGVRRRGTGGWWLSGCGCGLVGPALRPSRSLGPSSRCGPVTLLEKSGCFEEIPGYTAEGFDLNQSHLQHLRRDTAEVTRGGSPAFYWRRWSPDPLEHANFHAEVVTVDSPSPLTSGRACVLLDPAGKLVGFQAIPPDSVEARPGGKPDWNVFFAAAGLDSTLFTRITPAPPVPIACDEVAAWKGRLPGPDDEPVTLRMARCGADAWPGSRSPTTGAGPRRRWSRNPWTAAVSTAGSG
ncbi:MAG: protein kinase [bacterium]|nr:protein kinase [bacterium]